MKQPISASFPFPSILRKSSPLSPYVLSVFIFLILAAVLYGEDFLCIFRNQLQFDDYVPAGQLVSPTDDEEKLSKKLPFANDEGQGSNLEGCDIFSGKWVWDDASMPMYDESDCPYLEPQVTCQEHRRPDRNYQFWRWQPDGCSLPRFNATMMLEALRGKRMMFVGDSLNRNQFNSMICLLNSGIPHHNASSIRTSGSLTVFKAKEYNATVEFYWAPFLLESNSDNAVIHRISDRIVRKGSINKHGRHWKKVDIMVFNTYIWWMTGLKMKILRGSFDDEERDVFKTSTEIAYPMGLRSMLRWVKKNMKINKSKVFFVTMSPTHSKSIDWGDESGGSCYNQTTMITDSGYWGSDCRKSVMEVIGDVFSKSKFPVTLLNITQLSAYRRDAHVSIYKKHWFEPTPEQLSNPVTYADCVHWCLPGLPDTWNQLLFTKLFFP